MTALKIDIQKLRGIAGAARSTYTGPAREAAQHLNGLQNALRGAWSAQAQSALDAAFGNWLAGFDRYTHGKGHDVSKWVEMFGGRSTAVDRKGGILRTISIPYAAVSVCGGIQPGPLARALGTEHRENGLAARLLLAYPPRKLKRWTEAEISVGMQMWLYSSIRLVLQ